jgi:hypothetical protein
VDGAVFYNNPAAIALQESRAIWRDAAEHPPDILLSLGTGLSGEHKVGETVSGLLEDLETNSRMHKHFCAPLANAVFGDGRRYTQRWFYQDTAIFRSVSILKHRAGSEVDAEQQWTRFQASESGPHSREEGRYVRLNPKLDGKLPRLDDYQQMEALQTDVRHILRNDSFYRQKVALIAHRLVASCFYFDVVEESSEDGWTSVRGKCHIKFIDYSTAR